MPESRPVAFITGAGGGIGRAVAIELAATHDLIISDLSATSLNATRVLVEALDTTVFAQTANVAAPGALDEVVRAGELTLGTVSAAIACAGIEVGGTVETCTVDHWQRSIDVNLTGTFLTARAAIASLKTTRGSFTAIASDAGTEGCEDCVGYVAAKHGILGIVRSMAVDHGRDGVRSNAICPSFVETEMTRRILEESPEGTEQYYVNTVPLGRFAQPEEVATIVRHFVTVDRYTNGLVYALDGGATAGYYQG